MENQETVWEDTPEEQEHFQHQNQEEIKRMDVTEGDHRIALMSNPYFYKRHWLKQQKRSIKCPGEGCPICAVEEFPTGRYAVNVYNYKDAQVEILEIGRKVKQDIANAIRLWGNDISEFDLVLTRIGKTLENTKYTTSQIPRQEKLPKDLVTYDLTKIYKPTPIDKIIEILEGKNQKKQDIETSAAPVKEPITSAVPEIKKQDEVVTIEDETSDIDLDKLIENDN